VDVERRLLPRRHHARNVISLCRENGIPVYEKNFSLTDVYGADEAFVTGTFAGVVPAHTIDGRKLTEGRGPMVERLQTLYKALIERDTAARSRP
jgi:branched-chain amino acid aminotransferase